jgi:uncharacterized protein YbbC (DUF1343 family)
MASIDDERDEQRDLHIVSLYGDQLSDLVPKAEQLAPLDLLLIDLTDVGSRYYTFVWTALLALRAASEVGVHVVILDRPNPIGGLVERCEGRTQDEAFRSFVGWERVPIRHGLTLAEMVALFAERDGLALGPDGALSVVPVTGWNRADHAPSWDRPFVLPSPNMPTYDTALVYPGGCLLEGTLMSEGRGHTRPFEVCGAPWLDGGRLAPALAATGLEGFIARPLSFLPTFQKHGGKVCGGVQIHVTDRDRFRPVALYTALIALAHHHHPEAFEFRTERYEFVDDIPAFDLLTGSAAAREAIVAGVDAREVAEQVSATDPSWPQQHAQAVAAARKASWD